VGKPLNLKISNTAAVDWLPAGGLSVHAPVLISSNDAAGKISAAVRNSGELTLEAWISPANILQSGPARIVTVSQDGAQRNFTLGQNGATYEMRFRTTSTSPNGLPALSTRASLDDPTPICGLRNDDHDLAVVYFPAGGTVAIKAKAFARDFNAKWYNPRTGQWSAAVAKAKSKFDAPDEMDWVLLLRTS